MGIVLVGRVVKKTDWWAMENELSMVAMHVSKNRKECMEDKWKDE